MQSNQGQPQSTQSLINQQVLQSQSPSTPVVLPSDTAPSAHGISQGLKDGESPLDFIRNNLKQSQPQVDPQDMANAVAAQQAAQKPAEVPTDEPLPQVFPEDTKTAEPAQEPTQTPDELAEFEVENPAAENFKKLRTKAKELKKTLSTVAEENQNLKKKVTEYETGAVLPEVIQTKEEEIQRLSYYEKLVNFKGSKEYQEKYVKPVTELNTKLKEIAKDYQIPEETISQVLSFKSKADLNGFLSEHFDDVGALEVKDLVGKITKIQHEALEAEKAPAEHLANLQKENEAIAQTRRKEKLGAIQNTAKGSWVNALNRIRTEGKIQELIPKQNNSDHNEKIVKPLVTAASAQFGKFVRLMADNGMETLSDELAEALATSILLAQASAVRIDASNRLLEHHNEFVQSVQRTTSYERPVIGGGNGANNSGGQPKQTPTLGQAADQLLNKVLSGQR